MASSFLLQNFSFVSFVPLLSSRKQCLALAHSQFLSSDSLLKLKKQCLLSNNVQNPKFGSRRSHSLPAVYASQFNFLKVLQRVWKVGSDGIEAGTDLVPASIPRPVAKIAVTFVALTVTLFVLKSFLSTALFALGTMGAVYFIFIALNKDEGPRGGGGGGGGSPTSTEDTLEEARRIMEKYK